MTKEVGFKTYTWKDLPIHIEDHPELEAQKMFFIDTTNIKIMPQPKRKKSRLEIFTGRVKAAWSLLLHGDDYND